MLSTFFLVPALVAAQEGGARTPRTGVSGSTPGAPAAASASQAPSAGTPAENGPGVAPADPEKSYTIGFSTLATENLPPEYSYLSASIPELLRHDLSGVPDHTYESAERDAYAQKIIDDALLAEGKKLTSLYATRDSLLFIHSTAAIDAKPLKQQVAAAEVQINDERERISTLRGLKPADVEVVDPKPITFWSGSNGEQLLPDPEQRPRALCDKNGLDFLVWGTISYTDGYAFLDIYGYDRALDKVTYDKNYGGKPEELYQSMDFAVGEVTETILGRPSGSVAISADPSSALVSVDDNIAGFGTVTVRFLRPGDHTVTVTADGYEPQKDTVTITPGATSDLEISLSQVEREQASIDSSPGDANVYLGSEWQGVTPLKLPLPLESRELRIAKTGYLDSHLLLTPTGPTTIMRTLEPDTGDVAKIVNDRQEKFYRNLGWFALSIPFPLMLNGIYQNQVVALQESFIFPISSSRSQQIYVTGNLAYYGTWITAAISGGLLVNAIISLVHYINAAQQFHVR